MIAVKTLLKRYKCMSQKKDTKETRFTAKNVTID